MKKLCLAFVALLGTALFCPSSKADNVQYNISGVFGSGASVAALSGPNGSFSMSFSLPQAPTPDSVNPGDFAILNVPFNYSFQCDGCSTPVLFSGLLEDVDFATISNGGGLVVEFVTSDNNDYYWQFEGGQLFNGTLDHPVLIAGGATNLISDGQFELNDDSFVSIGNATLTAVGPRVSTPEPGSLTLLIAALASVGLLVWFKANRT
jgi:hypothetical protein